MSLQTASNASAPNTLKAGHSTDAIDIAHALIRCKSITPVGDGVMDVLQSYLEPLGFTIHRQTFTEEGYEPTENLYARLGDKGPNLCFAGHVDVVPPGDLAQWTHDPFEPTIDGGKLYGRGAEDMKGAIAGYVAAIHAFFEENDIEAFKEKGSLSLLITGDEEGVAVNGTKKMLDWLNEQGEQIDACIVGEPTNPTYLGEMIKIGRRGSITCDLIVRGKQGHVAYPHLADNPVTQLVNAVNEMQNYMLDEGTDFFPPSNYEVTSIDVANETVNLIPASAHAKFNVRFNDQHTGASIEEWLHNVCKRHCGDYELRCRISGEAFLTRNDPLTSSLVKAIIDVTGHTPQLSTTGGTSDARFIKDICPVIEFGTTGMTAHMIDECVSVETLTQLSQTYHQFIKNFFTSVSN